MPEYIERETLLKDIGENVIFTVRGGAELPTAEMRGANKVIDRIKSQPTVDVVEVKHGKWENNKEDIYWGNRFIRRNCSVCGGEPSYKEGLGVYELTPYCPYCGAKMDKE